MNDILTELALKIAEKVSNSYPSGKASKVEDAVKYYTVHDLCELLHISKATYYRHKELGYIKPTYHVGRKPLFDQKAIDDYLKIFN